MFCSAIDFWQSRFDASTNPRNSIKYCSSFGVWSENSKYGKIREIPPGRQGRQRPSSAISDRFAVGKTNRKPAGSARRQKNKNADKAALNEQFEIQAVGMRLIDSKAILQQIGHIFCACAYAEQGGFFRGKPLKHPPQIANLVTVETSSCKMANKR